MKITAFETEKWECDALMDLSKEVRIECVGEALDATTAERYADSEVVSTFIYSKMSAEVLGKLPKLKMIATRSTGFDHIDQEYCRDHGITICNVPTYGKNTVAEHTFALLLAISHRMIEAVDRTRRGDFSFQGLQGFDLRGKTLGVVGTGEIGECVIEVANGFALQVIAYDIKPRQDLAQRLGFSYVSMDELLERCDILTLHVPAVPQTRHMIGDTEFGKLKKGAVLINTSRGSVVDAQALVHALADGTVSAAGLDVLAEEPTIREEAELLRSVFRREHEDDLRSLLADNVLLRARNVIITPHSAFNTREAVRRILETTVENIVGFVQGEPKNVVLQPEPATA